MSDLVSQNLNMIFKSPKGETVHALKDLNFTIKKGELLTVLGPSGCGKTTLLNIAAGFIRPTSGTITLGNNEINGPGVDRGMVFQQGALFEWLTVSENVNFGLRMKKKDPEEPETNTTAQNAASAENFNGAQQIPPTVGGRKRKSKKHRKKSRKHRKKSKKHRKRSKKSRRYVQIKNS